MEINHFNGDGWVYHVPPANADTSSMNPLSASETAALNAARVEADARELVALRAENAVLKAALAVACAPTPSRVVLPGPRLPANHNH